MRRKTPNKAAQGFGILAIAFLMLAVGLYMVLQMMGYR